MVVKLDIDVLKTRTNNHIFKVHESDITDNGMRYEVHEGLTRFTTPYFTILKQVPDTQDLKDRVRS